MDWINSENHSKILGQHYPIHSDNIYNYDKNLFDTFNKFLTKTNNIDIAPSLSQAYSYTQNSQQMMSFYRPFYLEFKNMFETIDWTKNTLINLNYTDYPIISTYISKGFNAGFINLTRFMHSNETNNIQEVTGLSINYNAFNKDYGWFENNFTFESIIQPDLDNLQNISLNNTELSATLSAALLQPSLTKFDIFNINKKFFNTTLVLNTQNVSGDMYILSNNEISVLSGHIYPIIGNMPGVVYYNDSSAHTQIFAQNALNDVSGPNTQLIYEKSPSTLIEYTYFDKIQFNKIPEETVQIHLNKFMTDISHNCIFAPVLNLENVKVITISDLTTTTSYAFNDNISITDIPLTLIIPSTCTDMSYMFNGCINLSGITFMKIGQYVQNADGIYKNCSSIIELTNNTQFIIPENVVTTNQLFEGCKKLYIQQNQFNIETDILSSCNRMFKDCLELDKIPFILPTSVVNCSGMFENDEKIPLIPEGFTFHDGLINTNSMFKNCDSISSIPIWFSQTTTIKNTGSMFEGMHNIFKLDNTYTLPTGVINAENMFRDCANLVDLDVNRFLSGMLSAQYNEQIKLSGMFAECSILTGTISNDLVSALVELPSAQVLGMFTKCVNLTNYIEMPYILTLEENN